MVRMGKASRRWIAPISTETVEVEWQLRTLGPSVNIWAEMTALAFVLAFLSGLHIYWAFGGRWGWGVAIPQINKRAAFSPSRFATVIVAFGLATSALVPLVRTGTLSIPAPFWLSQWSAGVLSLVFCVRAVGDFRLVGFFKRVRGTPFAMWDTRLFSPLCLLLAAGFARVATL